MELRLSDEQLERYGGAYQREVLAFPAYAADAKRMGFLLAMPTFEEYVESYEGLHLNRMRSLERVI